jgi:hypothetical protein
MSYITTYTLGTIKSIESSYTWIHRYVLEGTFLWFCHYMCNEYEIVFVSMFYENAFTLVVTSVLLQFFLISVPYP